MKQFLLCTIALLCVLLVPQLSAAKEHRSEQIIGYFTEWGANAPSNSNPYTLKNVASSGAAKILTQLDYAFGKVVDDRCQLANSEIALQHRYDAASSVNGSNDPEGPNQLRGTFHQLKELKQLYPSLKIIISLGGWGGSAGFSSAAEPEHVTEFVRSCVDLFIRGHFSADITEEGVFDGVDLDWEYPVDGGLQPGKPEDKQDFTALAAEFRRQLDAVRPGLLLTAALPAEPEYYGHFDLPQISRYLDYISIMAYDLHWNTEKQTNFHSALYHAHADPSQPPLDAAFWRFCRARISCRWRSSLQDHSWGTVLWQRLVRCARQESWPLSKRHLTGAGGRQLSRSECPSPKRRQAILQGSRELYRLVQQRILELRLQAIHATKSKMCPPQETEAG